MSLKQVIICAFFLLPYSVYFYPSIAESSEKDSAELTSSSSLLVQAAVCERIEMLAPVNPAVVFSVKRDQVFCLTTFNPVPNKTFVYHTWFQRDKLVKIKRLPLNPPRWSTYSSIQLRQADKGPWYVEINDREGHLLKILRFSVTE